MFLTKMKTSCNDTGFKSLHKDSNATSIVASGGCSKNNARLLVILVPCVLGDRKIITSATYHQRFLFSYKRSKKTKV